MIPDYSVCWLLSCFRFKAPRLGQFVPAAQVKAVMLYPEVCILALSLLVPGFPGGSDGKESAYNAGDPGSIPGSGRFPGEGTGYPLQYSGLDNSIDRGAWQATVHGVAKGRT